jgi:hypothetical protein
LSSLSSSIDSSRKARIAQERLSELVFRPLADVVVAALLPLRLPPPLVAASAGATGFTAAVELASGHLVVSALLFQLKTVLELAELGFVVLFALRREILLRSVPHLKEDVL